MVPVTCLFLFYLPLNPKADFFAMNFDWKHMCFIALSTTDLETGLETANVSTKFNWTPGAFFNLQRNSSRISRSHTCNPRMPRAQSAEHVAFIWNYILIPCYDKITMRATPNTYSPFYQSIALKLMVFRIFTSVCLFVFVCVRVCVG